MSCDVVRTSQALCSGTGSGRSVCSSLGPGRSPYIITFSKMNISKTMTRKEPTRSTFTDSMDQMPTCGLLKSSVAICACLFGNMFIGKNKNPFAGNGSKEMKALEYFQNFAIPAKADSSEARQKEQSDQGTLRDVSMRQTSMQDRKALIERAEKKMQQLAMLYRDSWDMYRTLMSENLDNSPYKDNVRKIQILLSRVTKFLTFAHGKLDTLKTFTLLELIEILEELEYFLKLTSEMHRGKEVSQASLEDSKTSPDSRTFQDTEHKGQETPGRDEGNQSCSFKALGKGDAENNKGLWQNENDNKGQSGSDFTSGTSTPGQQGDAHQRNSSPTHRPGSVYITKEMQPEKELKGEETNIALSIEKLGCGDVVKDSDRLNSRVTITSFRCKQRSVYAGMKHPISEFDATMDIEKRVKSTISRINALGQVQTKIDKTRLEKIFGKIGRIVGDTNIKKPTKTKLEQISREFVKIKDTIVRLMKINKSARGIPDAGGKGDVKSAINIANMGGDNLVNLESYQKGMTEYETKLEQLNKKLEEVRTAYDLLRTISINALSHQNKKTEVRRLMTDLTLITQELNKIQPSFAVTATETTVLTVQTTNTFGDTESQKTSTSENSASEQSKSQTANQETSTKRISIAVDTSETAGMKWPNPRYQSVLYNFDSDEQSQQHVQEGNVKNENCEGQEDTKPQEISAPGEKGTQTRLDTISSWIEKHKAGEVVYEDSCIVTIGQPVRRTRSVNIINQESRKLATQKLQCQSSESIIAPTKSKQSENCRNRFKELLKVGRGFFERSCKKNMEKIEIVMGQAQEISDMEKPQTTGCSLETDKGSSDPSKKLSSSCDQNDSDKTTKDNSLIKGKLTMKNIQTSYDDFVVIPELLYVDKLPNGKSNYTCQDQDVRVKEAVENALAGIESAYSVALREFISILNTQGISIKMDSSSKSTSTTTLKHPSTRQLRTSMASDGTGNTSLKQVQYVSTISIDTISLKGFTGGNKMGKRVPLPSSRSRIVQHITPDASLHRDCLVEYINTFDNSSLLLIQNNNFK